MPNAVKTGLGLSLQTMEKITKIYHKIAVDQKYERKRLGPKMVISKKNNKQFLKIPEQTDSLQNSK